MTEKTKGNKMSSDPLKHRYGCLTPSERFALTIEAMARRDEAEADRLEDACPRLTYSHADAEFRDRMHRSYTIALLAMVNLQKLLALIRCSDVLVEQHRAYADGPKLVAACAFLFRQAVRHVEVRRHRAGRATGLGQAEGGGEGPARPEGAAQGVAGVRVRERVAEAVREFIGMGVGVEALSQWEGFERFCRRQLAVEPLTLLAAYGLGTDDPAAEVLAVFPGAKADKARAEERAVHWTREWERRFDRP